MKKIFMQTATLAIAIFTPTIAMAHTNNDNYFQHMENGTMTSGIRMMNGAGWMIFGWVNLALLWIVLVLAIIALWKYINRGGKDNK